MTAQADILRKLDALLNRHRTGAADLSDIPILTEVIKTNPPQPEAELEGASPDATAGNAATPALSDAEVEALARDIYQRVMSRLNSQISSELREHLTGRLSAIIDSTVGTAVADFKQELANTVADAIAEALLARAEKMIAPGDSSQT